MNLHLVKTSNNKKTQITLVSLLKRSFFLVQFKNNTKINPYQNKCRTFARTWIFAIVTLVHTRNISHFGYFLLRGFHSYPISCPNSSLVYVIQ